MFVDVWFLRHNADKIWKISKSMWWFSGWRGEKNALVWIHHPHIICLPEKPGSIFFHKRIFWMVAPRLFLFPHLYSSRGSPIFIAFTASSCIFSPIRELPTKPPSSSFIECILDAFHHPQSILNDVWGKIVFSFLYCRVNFALLSTVNWFKNTHVFVARGTKTTLHTPGLAQNDCIYLKKSILNYVSAFIWNRINCANLLRYST